MNDPTPLSDSSVAETPFRPERTDQVAGRRDLHLPLVDHFSRIIQSGGLRNGERLPSERQLMAQFDATRNDVRKAIEALRGMGLVVCKRGSGTFVSRAGERQTGRELAASRIGPMDVMETRLILETGLVDLVVSRATAEDFDKMEECLKRAEAAVAQDERRAATFDFRMEMVKATRNPLIEQVYIQVMNARDNAGWHLLQGVDESPEARAKRNARSRELLLALRERNRARAAQIMRLRLMTMVSELVGLGVSEDAPRSGLAENSFE